jgi:hypothetical protein
MIKLSNIYRKPMVFSAKSFRTGYELIHYLDNHQKKPAFLDKMQAFLFRIQNQALNNLNSKATLVKSSSSFTANP